jgi:general transcription factor 3C polypeptide 3 (transcription factor C subunit 4)
MECRVRLATLYEGDFGMNDEALKYINEALLIGRQEGRARRRKRDDNRLEQLAIEFQKAPRSPLTGPEQTGNGDRSQIAQRRTDDIRFLFDKLKDLHPFIKEGNSDVIEDWLDIADALLRDFRTNRIFYPMARTMEFQGYTGDSQRKGKKARTLLDEAQEIAVRLQKAMGKNHSTISLLEVES